MILIRKAYGKDLMTQVRNLFIEYAESLNIDLNFQNFDQELRWLSIYYSIRKGCLLLAYFEDNLAGCVGLRYFENGICEMKRLYVRPEFRRKKIGLELSKSIINRAKELGYKYIRLDTLPFMKEAINLYISLGFKEIPPYRYNPFEKARFYELKL
ncbi:MAG: GNAT family N-acetyltransferase [Promethearchaeota archaeon]